MASPSSIYSSWARLNRSDRRQSPLFEPSSGRLWIGVIHSYCTWRSSCHNLASRPSLIPPTYPQSRIPAFLPFGNKASVWVNSNFPSAIFISKLDSYFLNYILMKQLKIIKNNIYIILIIIHYFPSILPVFCY